MRSQLVFAAVLAGAAAFGGGMTAKAQQEEGAAPTCVDSAPLVFTPTVTPITIQLDGQADEEIAHIGGLKDPANDEAVTETKALLDEGGAWVVIPVTVTWEPACSLPDNIGIEVTHTVVLNGPGNTEDRPVLRTTDLLIDEVTELSNQIDALLWVRTNDIHPGRWDGTIPLRFTTGDDVDTLDLGVGVAQLQVQRQAPMWVGLLDLNPIAILVMGLLGGAIFGAFRVLALRGDGKLALFFVSDNRPARVKWMDLRNLAAVLTALGAGFAAWTVNYLQRPDYRLTVSNAIGLFSVVAMATITSVVTFFKPDAATSEDDEDGDADRGDEDPA